MAEKDLNAISWFFRSHDKRRECKLTYFSEGEEILKDENITASIDVHLNLSYVFGNSKLANMVNQNGPCFGEFSPNFQECTYDEETDVLIVKGKGNGIKKAYKAIFK